MSMEYIIIINYYVYSLKRHSACTVNQNSNTLNISKFESPL